MSKPKPLTKRRRQALWFVSVDFVSARTAGSIPSLVRRGLVTVEKVGGRLTGRYYLTDAGREELSSV